MPQKAVNSSQTSRRPRRLYTPEPVQRRVIALHMSGQSNRQIAMEEKIDRETVSRILTQKEVIQMVTQYQSRLLSIVPKAIRVYEEALESDDVRIALAAATKLMEGLRVLGNGFVEQPPQEPDQRQRKTLFLGQLMEMMLEKNRQYDVPLPPELSRIADEATLALNPTTLRP